MDVGNGILISEGQQWSFDNHVAKQFDNHIKLSVPLYEEGHELICYLSDFFMSDNAVFYEIGCSTGALIRKIYDRHSHKKNVRFVGIEPVAEMIEEAKKHENSNNIEYVNSPIEETKLEPCNLIVSYYCLQFVKPFKRKEVCKKIYDSLLPGGAFILFEKEMIGDPKINKLITSSYLKFKIHNGFTPKEVLSKQFSLEGMMKPNTHSANVKMLFYAGFKNVASVMRCGEFNGYICIKCNGQAFL